MKRVLPPDCFLMKLGMAEIVGMRLPAALIKATRGEPLVLTPILPPYASDIPDSP